VAQPMEGITYAHKIEKHEAAIDWRWHAGTIVRRVRAFNPFPVASFVHNGEVIKVWAAELVPGSTDAACGQILAEAPDGIAVAAMNSIVKLTELQRPGGKRLLAADFLRGFELQPGARLTGPTETAPHAG